MYFICFILLGSSDSSYAQFPFPNGLVIDIRTQSELLHHFVDTSVQLNRSPIQSRSPFEFLLQPQ